MAEGENNVKQDNRLPYTDPSKFMQEHNYTYMAVWRACGLSKHPSQRVNDKPVECLTLDVGASQGAFAMEVSKWELSAKGGSSRDIKDGELQPGEPLPWKCFKSETQNMVEHYENVAASPDPRKHAAKELSVKGAFAIFRDGAVYEFGGPAPMEQPPAELISSIGGSTGAAKALNVVHAVARLKTKAKATGAK